MSPVQMTQEVKGILSHLPRVCDKGRRRGFTCTSIVKDTDLETIVGEKITDLFRPLRVCRRERERERERGDMRNREYEREKNDESGERRGKADKQVFNILYRGRKINSKARGR